MRKGEEVMNRSGILPALAFTLLISGCAIFGVRENATVVPTVIEKSVLPTLPSNISEQGLYLKVELVISKRGAVRQVKLLNSSGDTGWDSTAAQTIRQWKYSPGLQNNKPVEMTITQITHVVSAQSLMVHLAQILFPTEGEADSALALLESGADFDSLAETQFIPNSVLRNGDMGLVDINLFAPPIQSDLASLKPHSFTSVLPLGPYYVIFKRVE